ncbi:MAG: cation diffusion facilitator family transporter [Chloroflexi bacterium]|nr:cation diffusion facilitator family transporter [Chloroflexota bacterium]
MANNQNAIGSKALKIALVIVLVIMIAEFLGGFFSNSLALISDAGHMLVDALALGLSLFAINIAIRPASMTRTYGYYRVEIMAALVNGTILVLLSIFIFYEAYQRFLKPAEVESTLMLIVAVVGLVANIAGIVLLKKASRVSLNIKAAFWHIIGDTVSSIGVVVGAVIIKFTGFTRIDAIIAVLIGFVIMLGAIRILKESADILLESVPKHLNTDKVIQVLRKIPGVVDIHDIHIWTISSGIYALSAHILVKDQTVSLCSDITRLANEELVRQFDITHTTLQLECEKCQTCSEGVICTISRPFNNEH